MISAAVKHDTPYKNLIVNGLVLAKDGTKLSKRLKNYTDPEIIVREYGADALRVYLMSSPLVKAENLKFEDAGVASVLKDMFLPWYNAYRFLTQNIVRLDKPFVFVDDITKLYSSFNITDKWIEAALHQLIKDVRKDMAEYKLYNVAPRVVRFLNDLTNWYVRLNRQRIKGEVSEEDMNVSLNVLFDVVLKFALLMSPQAPFLTEYMYLNLRNAIDEKSPFFADSIHFLNIPEVNEKLIDIDIQKTFVDVQEVIETARKLRENKKMSLKQPIAGIKILSKDEKRLENLKQLFKYIEEEVNVADISTSVELEKYISLSALPNNKVLPAKLKGNKDFPNIQNEIKKITPEQILAFSGKETIEILGVTLNIEEDIIINQKPVEANVEKHEAIGGKSLFVLLDTTQDESLKIKGFAREFSNRIQKFKKKAKVNPEDKILIFYKLSNESKMLALALEKERKLIESAIKKPLFEAGYYSDQSVIEREEGTIDKEDYEIFFTRLAVVVDKTELQVILY